MAPKPPYFTINTASGGYRARFFGGNGALVWWTEVYTRKQGAQGAIDLLKFYAPSAEVYDLT